MYAKNICYFTGLLVSVILGVISAVSFANFQLPFIASTVWIALSLGTLFLIYVIVSALSLGLSSGYPVGKCLKVHGISLLISSMGTIITSLIALSVDITFVSPFTTVLIAIGSIFLFSSFVFLFLLVSCLICAQNQHSSCESSCRFM